MNEVRENWSILDVLLAHERLDARADIEELAARQLKKDSKARK